MDIVLFLCFRIDGRVFFPLAFFCIKKIISEAGASGLHL
jgi:hypothetical protein